ncbi:MAG: hypothetical protein OXQ94_06550 [Gemmatimonadota bacterium]|nr:hypothetical protein [Gemmatimonadota bacterium]MDE2871333.1 hypothetical protein [Gemmatimonadota bacterium]
MSFWNPVVTTARVGSPRGHDSRLRAVCVSERIRLRTQALRTAIRHCPHLAVASFLAACDSPTEPPPPDVNEREVLIALFESAGGLDWWNWSGWGGDGDIDTWYGVETDSAGRVTEIQLDRNNLRGTIPSELGSLARLKVLSLEGNGLTGEIPPELGALANLEVLRLEGNGLTGEIPPELGALANLKVLNLRDNRLTGEVPPELGNLKAVETFTLRGNMLTGPIPPELGALASVRWLSLYINRLTGPIPPELLGLEYVQWLVLGHNRLTGPIPPELGSMRSLERLWLNDNRLTGAVPGELGDLGRWLDWLDFRANWNLSGPLPHELTQLTGLLRFEWGATGLCSPPDRDFQYWVNSVPTRYGQGPVCES